MKQINIYTYNELKGDAKKTALENFKKAYIKDYSSEIDHIKDDIFNCLDDIHFGFVDIYWDDLGRVTSIDELEIYDDFYKKHGFDEFLSDVEEILGLTIFNVFGNPDTGREISFTFEDRHTEKLTYENLYRFLEKYDPSRLPSIRLLAVTCPTENFLGSEDFDLLNEILCKYLYQMDAAYTKDIEEIDSFISAELDYYTSDQWAEHLAELEIDLYYTEDGRLLGEI
jgi:hypothetical protein